MERIAIISDIHGNLTALNAVLKDIEEKGHAEQGRDGADGNLPPRHQRAGGKVAQR